MDEPGENQREQIETNIAERVFANSPTMLALCLTVIGLIKIYANLQRISTLADNVLALAVVSFLFATVLSYLALRARTHKRRLRLARLADATFLAGLCCAAGIAVFVSYSLAG